VIRGYRWRVGEACRAQGVGSSRLETGEILLLLMSQRDRSGEKLKVSESMGVVVEGARGCSWTDLLALREVRPEGFRPIHLDRCRKC
jgi:hypothetical protein